MGRDTKQRLLKQGLASFMTKGFNHTGIQEVLTAISVPKGSFYHYFKSKDDFGLQVVQFYAQDMMEQTRLMFADTSIPSLDRFRGFFKHAEEKMSECGFSGGCFLGNMCQEMGDLNEEFEQILEAKVTGMVEVFTNCIAQGQESGEITNPMEPAVLANFLVNSWQGALLRMKVAKSCAPLAAFQETIFHHVLK